MYATREAAEADLRDVLSDEGSYADILSIVEIDFERDYALKVERKSPNAGAQRGARSATGTRRAC